MDKRAIDAHLERAAADFQTECTLALAMHFPIGWDPYFKDVMTSPTSTTTRPGTTTTTVDS